MNDKIMLLGLVFYGYHGVLPEEKKVGQMFVVDVDLFGNFQEAGKEDNLGKSVDYSQVFEEVKQIVEGKPYNLLEALAYNIGTAILRRFRPVLHVTVRVKKPHVPIKGVVTAAIVEMTQSRPL